MCVHEVECREDSMSSDIYASLIRRAYEDFESGDRDPPGVVDEHLEWHEPGSDPLAGDYLGLEAVLGYLGELRARSHGTSRIEVLDVLSEPGGGCLSTRDRKPGREDAQRVAAIEFEIHHQQTTEMTVYHGEMYHFDGLWEGSKVVRH
jgi:uncharacterized protein